MKTKLRLLLLLLLGTVASFAVTAVSKTTIQLEAGTLSPPIPAASVTVPIGTALTVTAPDLGPLHWMKGSTAIPGATRATLPLLVGSMADAGSYYAVYDSSAAGPEFTQTLILGVGPVQRLLNLSTRAQIGTGEKTFISGFVVAGPNPKRLVVRALGPALAQYGITQPLAQPVLSFFDQNGKPYTSGYVYPQYVGAPTYESDLADSLARAGATPTPAGSKDAVIMMPFDPGVYSVHLTSADGGTGVVLLEIFEVP